MPELQLRRPTEANWRTTAILNPGDPTARFEDIHVIEDKENDFHLEEDVVAIRCVSANLTQVTRTPRGEPAGYEQVIAEITPNHPEHEQTVMLDSMGPLTFRVIRLADLQ
ncbi:MAG: hypothetical protein WD988_03460 [Candidatus Curtissbacteria bacterium]